MWMVVYLSQFSQLIIYLPVWYETRKWNNWMLMRQHSSVIRGSILRRSCSPRCSACAEAPAAIVCDMFVVVFYLHSKDLTKVSRLTQQQRRVNLASLSRRPTQSWSVALLQQTIWRHVTAPKRWILFERIHDQRLMGFVREGGIGSERNVPKNHTFNLAFTKLEHFSLALKSANGCSRTSQCVQVSFKTGMKYSLLSRDHHVFLVMHHFAIFLQESVQPHWCFLFKCPEVLRLLRIHA